MSMFELPLISVCIPCFNGEKYIAETLTCLLQQTYTNIEIIIVDDGSTDNSRAIVRTIQSINSSVHLIRAKEKGAAAARNQAFQMSKGEYIIFFDADDLVDNHFIQSQYAVLDQNKNNVVVSAWGRFFGDANTFNEDPYIIKRDLTFQDWILGYWTADRHMTPPGRIMAPRELVTKSGLWDPTLSLNDDFQFFSSLFSHAKLIKYNGGARFKYRTGVAGLSTRTKTYKAQRSNLSSLMAGINHAILYSSKPEIESACANILQSFIYGCYPKHPELIREAQNKIKEFGGSNFRFPSGGYTKLMYICLGWKITKKIKMLLGS